ncbi:hypothetical protein X777_09916 [Ooceraea biroi]|uniref:Uncharacterized protein n=1 Tax=Ooceraea biroi TaxID=2015173 RepID=A0A026W891_OOCBI|nr:hypothetical protein X777_09916 [Ooceraea biroi]
MLKMKRDPAEVIVGGEDSELTRDRSSFARELATSYLCTGCPKNLLLCEYSKDHRCITVSIDQ